MEDLQAHYPDVAQICATYSKETVTMFLRNIVAMNADSHLVTIAKSILKEGE